MVESSEPASQPQFPVTIWESIAIAVGAVLLVAIGLAGLMYKFFSNAANPQRATITARSLINYTIPDNPQGVFGANLGGAKIAIVSNSTFPKDPASLSPDDVPNLSGVELFVARVPLDVETVTTESPTPPGVSKPDSADEPPYDPFSSPDFSFSYRSGEEFKVSSSRTEDKRFCNETVPVRIQTGELLLSSQLPPVQAVKYDAMAIFDNSKRQVTVTAIGQNAALKAESVFNSLRCK